MVELRIPTLEHLDSYTAALKRGWSPDNTRNVAYKEELEKIAKDPATFLAEQDDPEAKAGPVKLPDGSTVPRLPGFRRWLWDGEFCGSLGFRWQPGTTDLPPTCMGHVGYSIVPWKQKRGYATEGLRLLIKDIRRLGLPYILITTDVDNMPSQKVILTNGGYLAERSKKAAAFGGGDVLRFRIDLPS